MAHNNIYKDFTPAELYPQSEQEKHAAYIPAHSGPLDIYNAACLCNRCGACAQDCPSYKALQAELYSPRGRNQLVRLLLERKLNLKRDGENIARTVSSCIMCGQCSSVCAVNAPTAPLMAEVKTALGIYQGRSFKTELFAKMPKFYFFFKSLKYKLPKKINEPAALYMPNLNGLRYAKSSLNIISQTKGAAVVIKSGLLLSKAAFTEPCDTIRKILNNISAEYNAICKGKNLPVITDNIEDYRILKNAAAFGAQALPCEVLFITELIKKGQKIKSEDFKDKNIIIQNNNACVAGDSIPADTANIFDCAKADFFVKFNPKGPHSTGLLSYTNNIRGAGKIERDIALSVANEQADFLIVFSAGDKQTFDNILKRYYPYTKVLHIAEAAELFYDRAR